MELALYDSDLGYYARVARRSGRAGDFFTSVDVGPLFGDLLEVQLAEMAALLSGQSPGPAHQSPLDLVEAGAGNGRLSANILRAARKRHPSFYDSLRLHLVEASAAARLAQRETLGEDAERLASSGGTLPATFEGMLIANELLDAMPVHQVVMREEGLREVYVSHESGVARRRSSAVPAPAGQPASASRLVIVEGPPSTPALQDYLDRLGVTLDSGWRAEINLRAVEWIRGAARRLTRGFMVLIDYGHEARELYSATHSTGTLTSFAGHRSEGAESPADRPAWLRQPGERDITAHVDFTSVRDAAQAEGMTTIAFLDQTYFLMGLMPALSDPQSAIRNPQFKTLVLPGGLGSTHKVLILGKAVGAPTLQGCSFKVRVT
jgi:SAM-dependent MidA family methyltransferase